MATDKEIGRRKLLEIIMEDGWRIREFEIADYDFHFDRESHSGMDGFLLKMKISDFLKFKDKIEIPNKEKFWEKIIYWEDSIFFVTSIYPLPPEIKSSKEVKEWIEEDILEKMEDMIMREMRLSNPFSKSKDEDEEIKNDIISYFNKIGWMDEDRMTKINFPDMIQIFIIENL